jgi:hypothetical protein
MSDQANDETRQLAQLFGARVAVLQPDVIDGLAAAAVRQRLEARGYARYAGIDRGSYDFLDEPRDAVGAPLLAALQAAASKATGRSLALATAASAVPAVRALRLRAGDYLLAHHDRDSDDGTVELTLDLSASASEGAGVVYLRGDKPFFHLPSQPGALAIVERDGSVRCHHRYLSKRSPAAQVVRLVVRLQPA